MTLFLTTPRVTPTEQKFEVDLQLSFTADLIGGELQFVSLDVVNSNFNSQPLPSFELIDFQATIPFDSWQAGAQFGTDINPVLRSRLNLDSFASATSTPFAIANTDLVTVGTFTFNYQPLNLGEGDMITLDVTGVDDGSSTRTTSVVLREPGAPIFSSVGVNPMFAPGSQIVTLTAIPEPRSFAFLAFAMIGLIRQRRRSN